MSKLEWITEELSGQLAAHSNTVPFKTYWLYEAAWVSLTYTQGDRAGVHTSRSTPYTSLEEAKAAAELMEGES